ncbi:MAG: hypothetical protein D6732_04530 [Methanobacteriota archaeon]|nr:MAG: hypothetical protein D6732_04530 [Euryarchaeota archaeon]
MLGILVWFSCDSTEKLPSGYLPNEIIKDRKLFLSLSPDQKKEAWVTFLEEVQFEEDLSDDQAKLLALIIQDLRDLEKGKFYLSDNLKHHAIALAHISPRAFFVKTFYPNNSALLSEERDDFNKLPCYECIEDLEQSPAGIPSVDEVAFRATPYCDCRWTCSQQANTLVCPGGADPVVLDYCDGTNDGNCCTPTSSGCGFLFLQACTGYVTCDG